MLQTARRLLRFPSLYIPRFEIKIEREKLELKGTFGATTTAPRFIAIEAVSDSSDEIQGMHSDASTLRKASIWREASRIVNEEGFRAFWKGNLTFPTRIFRSVSPEEGSVAENVMQGCFKKIISPTSFKASMRYKWNQGIKTVTETKESRQ
ncbi:hypothetical protein LXL04_022869 [Taraxacum kok-saghyz]